MKANNWLITAKWYENTGAPRSYYLSKGNNCISIDSVYIVKDLKVETVDQKANEFTLIVQDKNRILKATTTENQKTVKEKPSGKAVSPIRL